MHRMNSSFGTQCISALGAFSLSGGTVLKLNWCISFAVLKNGAHRYMTNYSARRCDFSARSSSRCDTQNEMAMHRLPEPKWRLGG